MRKEISNPSSHLKNLENKEQNKIYNKHNEGNNKELKSITLKTEKQYTKSMKQ